MRFILLTIGIFIFGGCSAGDESGDGKKSTIPKNAKSVELLVKISVLTSGEILVDGVPTPLADVKRRLEKLSDEGGAVWYYREAATQEPPAVALQIIELVMENNLSISLSTKPDFSDYIDNDGKSHLRR